MTESLRTRFFSGAVFSTVGKLCSVILGFAGLLITSRWLSQSDLGKFLLLQTVVNLLSGLGDFGINTAVTQLLASVDDDAEKERIINTSVIFRFILFAFFCALFFILKDLFLYLYGENTFSEYIFYIPILFFIQFIELLFSSTFQGMFRFKFMGLIDVISSVTSFITIILFIVIIPLGVLGRIFARILSGIVGLILTIILSKWKLQLDFDITIIKRLLKFGFPLYLNYILTFAYQRADTLLIGAMLGTAEIALYEIARKIPESLEMLYSSFRQVYFPFISKLRTEGSSEKLNDLLNLSTRIFSFGGLLGSVISILFGKEIIVLLFSDKYLASVPVFSIMMIGLTLNFIDYTLGYTLVAVGDTNKPAIINTVHTSISLIGYIVFIPMIGFIGAAVSSITGTAVVNPINVFFLRKNGVDAQFGPYLKPILIFIGYSIPIALFPISNLALKIALILLFVLICFVMNIISLDDIHSLYIEGKSMAIGVLKKFALFTANFRNGRAASGRND